MKHIFEMQHIQTIAALRTLRENWKKTNVSVALVPTMGNLHAGHIALIKKAKSLAARVIVSIFVNPLQFSPHEDFEQYPRTLSADLAQLTAQKVDAVFTPIEEEIKKYSSLILPMIPSVLKNNLCGVTRPHYLPGVLQIVSQLFKIVEPDIAIFGEKDFEQCHMVCHMVNTLPLPVDIHLVETVREVDGLALSSRNQYLNVEERKIAPKLYATLQWMRKQITKDVTANEALCESAANKLLQHGFQKVDYISIRNKQSLEKIYSGEAIKDLIILVAAVLGKTRLIDNLSIQP